MSTAYWTSVQAEIGKNLDAAESSRRCLCARTRQWRTILKHRVEGGKLVSPFPGTYARPEYWARLSRRDQALHVIRSAAMLHPDWVFCHVSAALAHGLEVSQLDPGVVHIMVSRRSHTSSSACVIRHQGCSGKPVVASGVRATPFGRTVADCVRTMTFPQGLAVADSALRASGWSVNMLRDVYLEESYRRKGARHGLATIAAADGRADNGGESVARGVMIELGFEAPDLQVEVPNPAEPGHFYYVDFAWRGSDGRPVFGELDGKVKYLEEGRPNTMHALGKMSDERIRESHLTLYGARILRFPFKVVLDRPTFRRLLIEYGVPFQGDRGCA